MGMKEVLMPIAYPTKGSVGNTGLWRTLKPVINYEKCTKCFICWMYCPEAAILAEDKPVILYDFCKGCGICANECPVKAINMIKEV